MKTEIKPKNLKVQNCFTHFKETQLKKFSQNNEIYARIVVINKFTELSHNEMERIAIAEMHNLALCNFLLRVNIVFICDKNSTAY